jgi:hypothetical protein
MGKKLDVRAIISELWWGTLPIIGMLASAGLIALGMKISVGKW